MTHEQLQAEMAYHASLSPFTYPLKDGVISAEDYAKIMAILTNKYRPIFVGHMIQTELDFVMLDDFCCC